ncbi:hypothetical protein [Pseudoruegeria sp. SHC-113]|uniref:hypothetical protein n=1 Tax=Pseudoruegeria sp. SHC-113 TaxID=2855439 RepID=UPI0021BB1B0F|nr:hypothetical protein [Pseudoruegeria sp. SHC-113]MCT8159463.1 hypothetical protein [Pseudoruegeria sp. SHC-113]
MSFGDLSKVAPSACLDPEALPLTEIVAAQGGLWFSSESSLLQQEDEGVVSLRARCGGDVARAANGNTEFCGLTEIAGQPFLVFPPRKNAGFVADLGQIKTCVSLAVVHSDSAKAGKISGTLCAIATGDGASTLVLEDRGEGLRLTNRDGDPAQTVPAASGLRLSFLVWDSAGATYADAAGRSCKLDWPGAIAEGAAQLFIGCRRDSAGMLKTQGAAAIADVIAFPERDILSPAMAPVRARLATYLREVFTDGL